MPTIQNLLCQQEQFRESEGTGVHGYFCRFLLFLFSSYYCSHHREREHVCGEGENRMTAGGGVGRRVDPALLWLLLFSENFRERLCNTSSKQTTYVCFFSPPLHALHGFPMRTSDADTLGRRTVGVTPALITLPGSKTFPEASN